MEITIKSLPIYYEEHGTGRPLLMLHGTPVDHNWFMAEMEPIFENRTGWRRIYPDMPGHGKTPGADWITNQEEMLDIVLEFIQAVAPNQRFVVAGLSYGGYMAQGMVYKLGQLIDGVCLWIPGMETDKAKMHLEKHQILAENANFQAALTPQTSFLTDMAVVQQVKTVDWMRTYGQPAFALADWNFQKKIEDAPGFSFPLDQLASPFPGPTLIVTARQDSLVGYKDAWKILDNYPRGTFAVLDRAGHFLDIEQKSLLDALTTEWLNRVEEYIEQTSGKASS